MKPLVMLLLLVTCFMMPPARAQMRQVYLDELHENNHLKKISFYSPSEGYVAFTDWIGYTQDSGRTFIKKYVTISNVNFNGYSVNLTFGFSINGVKAFSRDTIIAYGDYGFVPAILYSTDAGSSFKLIYHSQFSPIQLSTGIMDMAFSPTNSNIGIAVDADRILQTTDKGLTWTAQRYEQQALFTGVDAVNYRLFAYNTGTAYYDSRLLVSDDDGYNWSRVQIPTGIINALDFITADKGWISVDQQGALLLYYTSDGGNTWRQMNDPEITPFSCRKMQFINDSTGYAGGGLYQTLKTTDSGKVWERLPRSTTYEYLNYGHEDLQCMGTAQLWAGGGHGYLELSTNAGGTPIPVALFKADTTGEAASHVVHLNNLSKTTYQYTWIKNGQVISNAYNTSYTRDINRLADTIQLVVTNGSHSDTAVRYVRYYPVTQISSFTPVTGGKGTTVTIKGVHFSDAAGVSFGGVSAFSFQVDADTAITAVVADGASGAIVVTTPNSTASKDGFTFVPPPHISSFTPVAAAAGTTVTINGANFTGATAVSFGGTPAVSFNVESATRITAVVGAGTSGKIAVTASGGADSLDGFATLPVISSFTPTTGTQGAIITISGTGFDAVTGVSFGGIAASSFQVNSLTSITAVVGPGSSGAVVVSKAAGNASLPGFTYFTPPVITAVTPASAPVGSTVIISGSHFNTTAAGNIVYFGPVRAIVNAASATSLSVTVPAGATYSPVTVTANALTAYSPRPFSVIFSGGGAITSSSFATRTDNPSNDQPEAPYDVQLGDFNNDGLSDMVAANLAGYTISVWQNTGSGGAMRFTGVQYDAGNGPTHSAIGDLDGDGLLDIATGSQDGTTYLFRNTTTTGNAITFEATTPVYGNFAIIADLNMDGKPDIITGSKIYRNISYPGHIAFAAGVPFEGGQVMTTADLDGDRKPDLVMMQTIGDVISVARNTSTVDNISFAAPIYYASRYPYSVVAGDLDGDNKPDLAAVNANGSELYLFRNTTTGVGNISFAARQDIRANDGPSNLAMNDLDGDGKTDLAVVTGINNLSVFKNISSTGNIKLAPAVNYATPTVPDGIAIGDLNGDGKPDIVTTAQGDDMLSIFTNNVQAEPYIGGFTPNIAEQGTIVTITGHNFTGATAVSFGGIAAATFTVMNDTLITATAGAGQSGDVSVTNTHGTGIRSGFVHGRPPHIAAFTPLYGPVGTQVTITGDHFSNGAQNNTVYFGGVQGAIVSATANTIVVKAPAGVTYQPITVTSRGLTAYAAQPFTITFQSVDTVFTAGSFAPRIGYPGGIDGSIADFDGDGKLDIVHSRYSNTLGILRNTGTPGNISFAPLTEMPTTGEARYSQAGDLNGDGLPDLVTQASSNTIAVYKNTSTRGAISFAPVADYEVDPSRATTSGISIADLDADGRPDVTAVNYYTQSLTVLRNTGLNGNIGFAPRINYDIAAYAEDVDVADIDADGKPDIIIVGSDSVLIYKNISIAGTILLEAPLKFAATAATAVETGDMDGDGKPDLVISSHSKNAALILRNISTAGHPSFASAQEFPAGSMPFDAALTDLDGDHRLDVVSANLSGNLISVFRNISTTGHIALKPKTDYTVKDGPAFTAMGDLDGDSLPDIVVFHNSDNISILRNQASSAIGITTCAGIDTVFTARRLGTQHQWQLNTGSGYADISDNVNFTGSTTASLHLHQLPASWDKYSLRCLVNGSADIAYVLTVRTGVSPEVELSSSLNTICSGMQVTFYANITSNGGEYPSYAWLVNGKEVAGATDFMYTTDSLRNGDQVAAVVQSDAVCVRNRDTSAPIVMVVNPIVRASGHIDAPDKLPVNDYYVITFTGTPLPLRSEIALYESIDNGPFVYAGYSNYYSGGPLDAYLDGSNTPVTKRYFFAITPSDTTCIRNGVSDTVTISIEVEHKVTVPMCIDGSTTITSNATGTHFVWQLNVGNGYYHDVGEDSHHENSNTRTLMLKNVQPSLNGFKYRCVVDDIPEDTVYALQINTELPTPVLAVDRYNLTVTTPYDNEVGYIWQKQGGQNVWTDIVPAENKPALIVKTMGTYRVMVNSRSCTVVSAPQPVIITAVPADPNVVAGVHLYPNPVTNVLTLDPLKLSDKWETLDIMSMDGSLRLASYNIAGKTKATVYVNTLTSGYYLAVLRKKDGSATVLRFVKM
ncbi:FG-GAP-like repeat-containing protein [Chitinophaga agrisoli]|nr:FG-GAP-like repeat-containing protein [Chitinophaga agrisoli]